MTATNGHSRIHMIEEQWHHIVDTLRGVENDESSRLRGVARRLREGIEAHPLAAAATAFALGYVVTRVARRRP